MAAPSSTVWGPIITGSSSGRKGKLGIYTSISSTNTQSTVNVQVWFWTIYSCTDDSNTLYFNIGTGVSSATTSQGSKSIVHTVESGSGWSTANQTKLLDKTYTYNRPNGSDATYKIYARFTNVDILGKEVAAGTSVKVPKRASYTVSFNANGGSGAPSSQTKYYGTTLTLSSTKPTRTGYTFQGWSTSATGSVVYSAGGSYTANASDTLYAVWKATTFTVTFDANGGSGAPSPQTKTYGVGLPIPPPNPERDKYTFLGWSTSKTATAASFTVGDLYKTESNATLYAVWILAYTKPRITGLSVTRCDANGNKLDSGTYAKVSFTWAADRTVSSILIEALAGTSTVQSTELATSSNSVNEIFGSNALNNEITYTIRVTVTDEVSYTRKSATLPGLKFVMDCKQGGTGVAFGKPAELDGYVGFGWGACFNNYLGIHGVDLDGNVKQVFQPQNENGNTVIGWDNYDMKSGYTNIYGHDVHIGVSNIKSPDTFRPYRRQGDSLTFSNLRTAGYVTNAGKDVTFLVPFAVPILGSPTATATSVQGFVLRQGEAYTHGSGASTYVFPDSYTATVSMFCGVYVTAHFSNTTNVINNAPIGIYWSGTITFT